MPVPSLAHPPIFMPGGIVAQNSTKIIDFTKHGIDRVVGDGAKLADVKPEALLDALRIPRKLLTV